MSDVKNWSTVAANNNAAPPNGWPENMAPSNVNNCARENMAALKRAYLHLPYFSPGGTVTYVNASTFTIADDTIGTEYNKFYIPGRRIKVLSPTGDLFGFVGTSTYSSGSSTITVTLDNEADLPSNVTDVYVGLTQDDASAFQGPNLLGMVLPWTADPENIPPGFGLADGGYFDKNIYTALEALYDTGDVDPDTGNKIYLHGGVEVDGVWQPRKPDVRGYFPRFLDTRTSDGVDPDAPRTVGSIQDHALQEHKHDVTASGFISGTSGAQYTGLAASGSMTTNGVADGYNKSTETRPANIALPGLLVMYGGYSSAEGLKVEDLLALTEADAHAYIDTIADPITGAVAEARGYAEDAKGYKNQASGFASDASGYATQASGYADDASGYATQASGYVSDAQGYASDASGYATQASGYAGDASGYATQASGYASDAQGYANEAKGYRNQASGYASDASGYATQASGYVSDAQGYANQALGYRNQASGFADAAAASAAAAAASKPTSNTYTLAAASWVGTTYNLTVPGLKATSTVLVSPAPSLDGSNEDLYTSSGVRATTQTTDTLTFACTETPASDVSVVLVIYP